jgi:uncharacterized membrane protein
MYELVVFFHILGGFFWIGGVLYVQSIWHRMILSDSDDSARGIFEAIEWSANRVIVPAALVVLAAGITMVAVNDAWAFSQLWVILALVLFVVSAFGFGTWTDKLTARSLEHLAAEGVKGPNYVAATRKLMNVVRVDSLVVVGILALMVFKPGA